MVMGSTNFPGITQAVQFKRELMRKYGKGGKVGTVMREFGRGALHSGSKRGPTVTNRKQAIAIALSEQRKYESPLMRHGR